jgi:hypothetical protein
LPFYDVAEAEIRINSAKAQGGSDAIKVSLIPNLHFLRTFVHYRGVMNMPQKLLVQLLLGFILSSLYLAAFLLTVHQQRTSYLSLTQAPSPQKFVNLSAEEMNGRTIKAAAEIDRSYRRY